MGSFTIESHTVTPTNNWNPYKYHGRQASGGTLQRNRSFKVHRNAGLLHPGRLTWNTIMKVWKIIFLFNWMIFMFHVNLPGWLLDFGPWKKKRLPNSGITQYFLIWLRKICVLGRPKPPWDWITIPKKQVRKCFVQVSSGGFGFPTWFFRGPFFAATLVAYVAVSPYHQRLSPVFFFALA